MTLREWGLLLFWAGPAMVLGGTAWTAWRFRGERERGGAPRPAIRRMQRLVLAAVAVPWLVAAAAAWAMPGMVLQGDEQLVLSLVIIANLDLVLWFAATTVVVAAFGRHP